jgi:DNA polymerase III subunit chi
MTEVGFYHLLTTPIEKALPGLLVKALDGGLRAVVLAGSDERVEALSAALWTFDPASFVPHGTAKDGEPERQPIYLTTQEENPNGARLLVITDGLEPAFLDGFERCADMFDGNDPEAVSAARARWRKLRDAGHTLTYWRQKPQGGWEEGS